MNLTNEEKLRIVEEEKIRKSMTGKNVLVALLLSATIPGLGDLYCGSWIKAIIFACLLLTTLFITFVTIGMGGFLFVPLWVFGIISAWFSANKSERKSIVKAERALVKEH